MIPDLIQRGLFQAVVGEPSYLNKPFWVLVLTAWLFVLFPFALNSLAMSYDVTIHPEEHVQATPFTLLGHKAPSGNTWEMDEEKNLF